MTNSSNEIKEKGPSPRPGEDESIARELGARTTAGAKFLSGLVIVIGLAHGIPGLVEPIQKGDWSQFFTKLLIDFAIVFGIVLLIILLGKLFDYIEHRVEKHFGGISLFEGSLGELVSQQAPVTSKEFALFALSVLESVVLLFVTVFSVTGAFLLFPKTKDIGERYIHYLLDPIRTVLLGVVNYIPNLIFIAIVIWIARGLDRFLRILAESVKQKKIRLELVPPDAALQVYAISRVGLWLFVFVALFHRLPGAESAEFKAVAGFVALLISLSSTSAAGNFVAGVVMTFMRPFRVGDRIRAAGTEGKVIELSMMVTRILTAKNEYVTIPNLNVLQGSITNFTRIGGHRGVGVSVEVTIGYDVPQKTVERLLTQAAAKCVNIEPNPEPFVLQQNLGDFSIAYELIAFTKQIQLLPRVRSDLIACVIEEFASERVEILSPMYQANRDGNAPALPTQPNKASEAQTA